MACDHFNNHALSRAGLIQEARRWLGTPYRHQGSCCQAGTDCLGLLRGLWRALYGKEPEALPAYRRDWAEEDGEELLFRAAHKYLFVKAPEEALPGDLLFFRWRPHFPVKHCALLATDSTMIHAYSGAQVVEARLSPFWQRKLALVGAFPGFELDT